MAAQPALTLVDISWLRSAAAKAGALNVPQSIAARLVAGSLVVREGTPECLKITARGQLALTRLS